MKMTKLILLGSVVCLTNAYASNYQKTESITEYKIPVIGANVKLGQKIRSKAMETDGAVTIIKNNKFGQIYLSKLDDSFISEIYFNGTIVNGLVANVGTINILDNWIINSKPVYLIASNGGGSSSNDYCDKQILQINSKNSYSVSPVFCIENYISKSTNISSNQIALTAFDGRRYAFFGNNILNSKDRSIKYTIVFDGHTLTRDNYYPNEYYLNKLRKLTPEQIINLAKKDSCYDDTTHQIMDNNFCGMGLYYCALFNYIKPFSKYNTAYKNLNNSCKQGQDISIEHYNWDEISNVW